MGVSQVQLRKRTGAIALIVVAAVAVGVGSRLVHVNSSPRSFISSTKVSAAEESLPLVTVAEPERRTGVQTMTLPASAEAIESATLYAKVSGYVQSIRVDKGDRVKKGDLLAQLEVPEVDKEYQGAQAAVAEAQAEYEGAEADASLKQVTYQRTQGVRNSEPTVVSPQEVDVARTASETAAGNARLAQAHLDKARAELGKLQVLTEFAKVTAPFEGVVTERFVDPGALIQAGSSSSGNPIVSIASIDQVRVYISVPEGSVSQVRRGLAAEVRLNAFPERPFSARVTRFADSVDPRSRTMKTEIDLPNPDHRILPGMFGTVTLELSADPNAVFLPDQAIRQDGAGKKYVFTVENGGLRKVAVETGQDNGTETQVFGLGDEKAVVVSGGENLQEGTRVNAVKGTMQLNSSGGR